MLPDYCRGFHPDWLQNVAIKALCVTWLLQMIVCADWLQSVVVKALFADWLLQVSVRADWLFEFDRV